MSEFMEIKCMTQEEQEKIWKEIQARIRKKLKEGLLKEREVKEIENMKLRPIPDIQDVQSVYEDLMFRKNT